MKIRFKFKVKFNVNSKQLSFNFFFSSGLLVGTSRFPYPRSKFSDYKMFDYKVFCPYLNTQIKSRVSLWFGYSHGTNTGHPI